MNLADRINARLDEIELKGLRRKLESPAGIDLSSNDYLALADDERLKSAIGNALRIESVGSTGSRLLRGERDIFREVETQFAAWKGTERSLFFATGYQANIGLMQTFLEEGDVVFSDALNHASLIDGIRLSSARKVIYDHCRVDQLEKLVRGTDCEGQKFLVTESLFSMDGDIAPLDEYAGICHDTGTNLIIDEAHAVGIYGEKGSGLIEEFGIADEIFISINTAGKALGVSGAFLAGSEWAIEYLIQKARPFIFSTAPIPAVAHALYESIKITGAERERAENLLSLSMYVRKLFNDSGIPVPMDNSQIVPIMIGDNEKAVSIAETLRAKGFDIRAIRPPTVPAGTARLRVSLNCNLTESILTEFVGELGEELNSYDEI